MFTNTKGKHGTPLIDECPVSIECKVAEQVIIKNRHIFIAEVLEKFIDDYYTEVFLSKHKLISVYELKKEKYVNHDNVPHDAAIFWTCCRSQYYLCKEVVLLPCAVVAGTCIYGYWHRFGYCCVQQCCQGYHDNTLNCPDAPFCLPVQVITMLVIVPLSCYLTSLK
jgi:hypothetical protein